MKPNRFAWFIFPIFCAIAPFATDLAAQSVPSPQHQTLIANLGLSQQDQHGDNQAVGNSSSGLTLEQLEQMATAHNPTLAQAQAGIHAAQGRVRQAGLWPNPTVGYTGSEIRGGSFGGGEQGFFVQQQVLLGGKLRLSQNVFKQEQKQAEAEAEEQHLRVENGVRIAFYQSLAAQQMVELRQKLNDLAKDALQTTQQLFNVGQADQPDALQAQVEADEAELALVSVQQEQQRAWSVLAATVGQAQLPLSRLQGDLENSPALDPQQTLETILRDSPAVKIAQLGVARAEAETARARREPIPDLMLRTGYQQDRELLEPTGSNRVGGIGFAEAGINIPLFNRNQGNIAAARSDTARARQEVERVALVLRQQAAPLLQGYATSRAIADRYRTRTLPSAQKAYELYLAKYHEGGAAYPQVLIAQRTFFRLQVAYVTSLENIWTNASALQGLLLTDGLDQPSTPGTIDQPVREINMPVTETPGGRQ
ncbi:MAG: TolC family protein [Candidatus Acidiferrales bacterium]